MATRREMQQRRQNLRQALLTMCRSDTMKPGEMIPPVRELARTHDLSPALALQVVQGLVQEGLLYSQQGAGTFFGRPENNQKGLFLLLMPDALLHSAWDALRSGFEDFMARQGCASATMGIETALSHALNGTLPRLAGVCEFCALRQSSLWSGSGPVVELREMWEASSGNDTVYIDNEEGGFQAAQHLLQRGYRSVAFLALHGEGAETGEYDWSRQRENGWRRALRQAGIADAGLAFHPSQMGEYSHAGQHMAARLAAQCLLQDQQEDIPAVVAANAQAAKELFSVLTEAGVPGALWPAVVAFDDYSPANSHLLSALSMPTSELGRQGAKLLWERVSGRLSAATEHRSITMRLIPRLSCQPAQWSARDMIAVP